MNPDPAIDAPADRARRDYGGKIVAVEPGGNEAIPAAERHGRPLQLFWTWTSPNLEFATVFVGVLAVAVFGLTFWQAVSAVLLGDGLAALAHGVLSARGPAAGVPQMVLSRLAFGYRGNLAPAGLMTITAGCGWFAVNSVSASFALNSLTGIPVALALVLVVIVQVGVAFFGHNLVQAVERFAFPVLAVIFLTGAAIVLASFDPGVVPAGGGGGGVTGFLLTVGAAFGYTAGWTPYAADYARYLPADSSPLRTGLAAGVGMFVSTTVLMVVGAASVSAAHAAGLHSDNPVSNFVGVLPGWVGALTLLAIVIGAIAANVLNVYSGALAFLCMGIDVPLRRARAAAAIGFGLVGLVIAYFALGDAAHDYESFLLVVVYWIGPWLGITFADMWLRRGASSSTLLYDRTYTNPAGVIALVAGIVVAVVLFANQELYVGLVAAAVPEIGDVGFLAGFVVAAVVYAALLTGRTRR